MLEDLALEFFFTCLNTGEGSHVTCVSGVLTPLNVVFVSSNLTTSCDWHVLDDPFGSDHHPCVATFGVPVSYEAGRPGGWAYKGADWGRFQLDCSSEINSSIVCSEDPPMSYSRLANPILDTTHRYIPVQKINNPIESKVGQVVE